MAHLNIEIKARSPSRSISAGYFSSITPASWVPIRKSIHILKSPPDGWKLRQGTIENALIYYRRPDQSGPKQADVWLYRFQGQAMKELLTADWGCGWKSSSGGRFILSRISSFLSISRRPRQFCGD
jgi:hypothetical protein